MRDLALHRAFRAVLEALAHPGRSIDGPLVGGVDVARRTATLAIEAIWDAATSLYCVASPALPLRFVPCAAELETAEVIVVEGAPDPALVGAAKRGSEELPEGGATFVCIAGAPARTPVRLSGPGIDGETTAALPLEPAVLAARDEACASYPLGIDFVIFESDGRIVGLPRTTKVDLV